MRIILALALAALAGCATSQGTPDEDNPFRPEAFAPRGGEIRIFANNVNFADATLYAIHDGGRERLGIVSGKSSNSFTLDWPGVRDLRIRIDLLASDNYTTPGLSVSPGDRVQLTIETVLRNSQIIR